MNKQISRRRLRGHIFVLRNTLKQYVRESGTEDIQKELMILRNLTEQVFVELGKEQKANG